MYELRPTRCLDDFFGGMMERFLNLTRNTDAYLASFCVEEHDVSQWERYGDQGRGVAIGFGMRVSNTGHRGTEAWASLSFHSSTSLRSRTTR